MINFYNVDLKHETVTVVDIRKDRSIIISPLEDGFEIEFSTFGFGQQEKSELLNNDPYFKKYIKQHPEYLQAILKSVFEKKVEVDIDE